MHRRARLAVIGQAAAVLLGSAAIAQLANDYPSRALREGREGTAHFTAEIDELGRADKCTITQSTGWQDLDDAACNLVMLRARFKPAIDAAGRPVRSTYSSRVIWKLPR